MLKRKWLLRLTVLLVVVGVAAWHYQSRMVGLAARFYLQGIAAAEEKVGDQAERTKVVAQVHRMLLLQPPPPALVPELYDVTTLLAERAASGAISWSWSAYLYTSYMRDALGARPSGVPRLSRDQVNAELDRQVHFFSIRQRDDDRGLSIADFFGADSVSVEEVEAAYRAGRDLSTLKPGK